MDVQTRDGILLRGIPDGTPDEAIKARIEAIRAERAPQPKPRLDAVEPPNILERGLAAIPEWVRPELGGSRTRSLVQGAADPTVGAAQLAANAVGAGAPVNAAIAAKEQEMNAERAAAGREGFDAFRLAGSIASPATVLPLSRLTAPATLGGRVAQGAAVGGASGLVAPVADGGEDFGRKKIEQALLGAALGGGLPLVGKPAGWLAGKAWEKGRDLLSGPTGQVKQYLAEVFGDQPARAKVAERLMALRSDVTGEQPTAGLAAVEGGAPLPALKALEEGARGRRFAATGFAARDVTNEAARRRPLEAIRAPGARPPAEQGGRIPLSRAEQTRETITTPLYAAAGKEQYPMDEALQILLGGAEVQPAVRNAGISLDQAATNAAVAGRAAPTGVVPGRTVRGYDLPEWSVAGPRTPDVVEPAKVSIEALQRVQKGIDREIAGLKGTTDAAGATKLRQLQEARGQLDQWMRAKSKGWAEAQDTYRALSGYQNEADVAEQLLNALQSPAGVERQASFLAAKRNAPSTIGKADLGRKRFEAIEQVFSPTQMRQTNAIESSLAREGQYRALDAKQSVLPEMRGAFDAIEAATPNWINAVTSTFRKAMSRAGGALDAEAQGILDRLMLEPQKLAAFIQQATPAERDVVSRYMRGVITQGRLPATAGAALSATSQGAPNAP